MDGSEWGKIMDRECFTKSVWFHEESESFLAWFMSHTTGRTEELLKNCNTDITIILAGLFL